MSKYDEIASKLQTSVRIGEEDVDVEYGAAKVNQSIVHTREDLILVVSHLSSINKQLNTAKFVLVCILLALLYLCFK